MYVVVLGNIGSGKSMLMWMFVECYGLCLVYELYVENFYLEDFYYDM